MLEKLAKPLTLGQSAPLTLMFADGRDAVVEDPDY